MSDVEIARTLMLIARMDAAPLWLLELVTLAGLPTDKLKSPAGAMVISEVDLDL